MGVKVAHTSGNIRHAGVTRSTDSLSPDEALGVVHGAAKIECVAGIHRFLPNQHI